MFRIIQAAFNLFRVGQVVSNPAAWKNAQLVGAFLTALVSLGMAFGYDLGLSDEQIAGGAAFIVAVVNGVLVVITSKKVGLPSKNAPLNKMVDDCITQLNTSNRVQRVPDNAGPEKRNTFGFPTERNG